MIGIDKKVLILDEDQSTENLLSSIFSKEPYKFMSYPDPKEALNSLKEIPSSYKAVFINTTNENVDYINFKAMLKKDPSLNLIPIIQIENLKNPRQEKTEINFSDISILKKDIMDRDDPQVFHLTSPLNPTLTRALLATLEDLYAEKRRFQLFFENKKQGIELVDQMKATIANHEEATQTASFLALFCSHPEYAAKGIQELLFNAIEHGSYEIGYDLKGKLLKEEKFEEELINRKKDKKYKDRKVDIILEKRKEGVYIQITDQGPGFDFKRFLEVSPSRATHLHGRGIATSNKVYFDKLAYNEKGNQVTCFVSSKRKVRKSFWD